MAAVRRTRLSSSVVGMLCTRGMVGETCVSIQDEFVSVCVCAYVYVCFSCRSRFFLLSCSLRTTVSQNLLLKNSLPLPVSVRVSRVACSEALCALLFSHSSHYARLLLSFRVLVTVAQFVAGMCVECV